MFFFWCRVGGLGFVGPFLGAYRVGLWGLSVV